MENFEFWNDKATQTDPFKAFFSKNFAPTRSKFWHLHLCKKLSLK